MTPEDVHRITFAQAPFGRRGYREQDVDELLDLIAAALAGRATLTSEHLDRGIRTASSMFQRGYHPDQVDHFLEQVRRRFGF
ncbi:DivIVA domain-containing protein [Nocardia rhamnosiphila]|uniref:DivIVA domain-containing protein n=1 Tax=Nocardia rhamnosiphila TaxID=426716 RepID=UPI0006925A7A|nr:MULTISPECIES: DivIVA domain-containing protein [Nocardia]MCX0272233.1 DivIVA domain-containing protein [Nocardia zapadnayensis]